MCTCTFGAAFVQSTVSMFIIFLDNLILEALTTLLLLLLFFVPFIYFNNCTFTPFQRLKFASQNCQSMLLCAPGMNDTRERDKVRKIPLTTVVIAGSLPPPFPPHFRLVLFL